MVGFDVVGDLAGQWTEATASLSGGMKGLGVDGYADSLDKMVGALDLLSGSMAIASTVKEVVDAYNSYKAAKAVAETASNVLLGPVGWGKIALALGVTAVTAGTLFAVTNYTLKADLSNPSEAMATSQMIGAIA